MSLGQQTVQGTAGSPEERGHFQRSTLQRKNLKHLTLLKSSSQDNNVSSKPHRKMQMAPLQNAMHSVTQATGHIIHDNIQLLQNDMNMLTVNDSTQSQTHVHAHAHNTNTNSNTNRQFHPLRLRRQFNHKLNINANSQQDTTVRRNVSSSIPASAVSFTSSPTSSESSSSSSISSVPSSPLELQQQSISPMKPRNDSQQRKFNNHLQKINVTTSTEEVIFNHDCVYQLQDMVKLGKIGEGNSGTVTKVLHVPTSTILCKKTIPIEKNNKIINQQLISELSIMKSIKPHPNIISFYGALINHSINDEIVILMEYMDCGSLDKILTIYKNFKQRKMTHGPKTWFNNPMVISKISHAVLAGLAYLYENYKIIHRDIKPSNVLVNCHGEVKICDFGVSKKMINSIANTFVGTSTYMSPERIQGNVYSTKGDVWSLGLVIIELVTGEFPLGGHNDTPDGILDLLQRIVNEPAPCLPINNDIFKFPIEMIDFVNKCCMKEAKLRSTIKDLLSHPFILHYNDPNGTDYTTDFKMWCKKVKSKMRKDKQIRKECIERAKLEKRQSERNKRIPT